MTSSIRNNMRWDIFCAVVDNYGDIGTCWRLARQLAVEYQCPVRLWVDHLETFARLCPSISIVASQQNVGLVEVRRWSSDLAFDDCDVADVVIEAFACELPAAYVAAMSRRPTMPVWINLEYLSAEKWVEECHLLSSVQSRSPLKKTFFFPGFTPQTGGLLRERNLLTDRAAFDFADAAEFWQSMRIPPRVTDELRISLFCYQNSALPPLLQQWSESSVAIRVLATPGRATEQISHWFGGELSPGTMMKRGALTVHAMPFLSPPDYDKLLWSCDINFVRGEDSFIRAQWAQRPFIWQIYPQQENAHWKKLDAFLQLYLAQFPNHDIVEQAWRAWNGIGDIQAAWNDFVSFRQTLQEHTKEWVRQLDRTSDLANNLVSFVQNQ